MAQDIEHAVPQHDSNLARLEAYLEETRCRLKTAFDLPASDEPMKRAIM